MNIFALIGISVIGCALVLLLKRQNEEAAMLLGAAVGVILLIFIIGRARPLFDEIQKLFDDGGIDSAYFKIAFKSLGICCVAGFASDICRDFGQTSISNKIELAAKVMVAALCLPLVKGIIGIAENLVRGK